MTILTPASESDRVKVASLMGLVISPGRSDMVFVPYAGRFVRLYRVPVPIGASKPRSATQSAESRLGPQDDQMEELLVN